MNTVEGFFSRDVRKFARSYFDYLHQVLSSIDLEEIRQFTATLLDARDRGATVFFIGNGGSAATASHFSNDLAIGTRAEGKKFKVLSLTDNFSLISAVGNDSGFDRIFEQQLKVFGNKGDVLVAISASGNSPNLLAAFEYAKSAGIRTVALTAFDGGKMKMMADQGIHVPTGTGEYGPAEDAHLILDHLVHAFLTQYIRAEA
jgi:D-sedoheptulose 7-phosphate isomerase